MIEKFSLQGGITLKALKKKSKSSKLMKRMLVALLTLTLVTPMNFIAIAASTSLDNSEVLFEEAFEGYVVDTTLTSGQEGYWDARGSNPEVAIREQSGSKYVEIVNSTTSSSYYGKRFTEQTDKLSLEFDINIPSQNGGTLFINKGNINDTSNSALQLQFNAGKLQKRNSTVFANYDTTKWYRFIVHFDIEQKNYVLSIVDLSTDEEVATDEGAFTNTAITGIASFGFSLNQSGGSLNIDNVKVAKLLPQEVSGLTATPGNAKAKLQWQDPNEPDFTNVNIYQVIEGNEVFVSSVNKGTTTATLTQLINGVTYTYIVRAEYENDKESTGLAISVVPVNDTISYPTEEVILFQEAFEGFDKDTTLTAGGEGYWDVRGSNPSVAVREQAGNKYVEIINNSTSSSYYGKRFTEQSEEVLIEFDINAPTQNGGFLFINQGNINETSKSALHLEFNAGKLKKRNSTEFANYDSSKWYRYSIYFDIEEKSYSLSIVDLSTDEVIATDEGSFNNSTITGISSFGFSLNQSGGSLHVDNVKVYNVIPLEVSELNATPGNTQATLYWQESSTGQFEKVNIYQIVNGSEEKVYSVNKGITFATLTGLTNGTTYQFIVKLQFEDGLESVGRTISLVPVAPVGPPPEIEAGTILIDQLFETYSTNTIIDDKRWSLKGTLPTATVKEHEANKYLEIKHDNTGSSYFGLTFPKQSGGLIMEFDVNIPSSNGGFLFINDGAVNSTSTSALHLEFNKGLLQKRNAAAPYATYNTTNWYRYYIFFNVDSKTLEIKITDLSSDEVIATVSEPFNNTAITGINNFGFAVNALGGTLNVDNIRVTAINVQLDALDISGATLTERFESYWTAYELEVPFGIKEIELTPFTENEDASISINDGALVPSGTLFNYEIEESTSTLEVKVESIAFPGVMKTYTFDIVRLDQHPNVKYEEYEARNSSIFLGWTEPNDPTYVGANIYLLDTATTELSLINSVNKGTKSLHVPELINGQEYSFVIKALYEGNIEASGVTVTASPVVHAARQMEYLDRGMVAVKTEEGVYVGWRYLGTDPTDITFNLYRDGEKVNSTPIQTSTNYVDHEGTLSSIYEVRAVINSVEQASSDTASVWNEQFLEIDIQKPEGGISPDNVAYEYKPREASVGDLDGDGQYEIVVKWGPTNLKDNGQQGYTGPTYFDAYELDGTLLWRINTGLNIRSGAHYNHFFVYDLDGDGKAELALKTADGTVDGEGIVIGDPEANYVDSRGVIITGPEYLTVFEGSTGKALSTVDFVVPRGDTNDWGDNYGNRQERYLGAVAYLDGVTPSLVMGRGYYTRMTYSAYDFKDGQLTHRWTFDSNDEEHNSYYGQGNHQQSIADVDGDGKDEILTGAAAIDDDGTGLWNSLLGHGDALHVGDLDPTNPGLEIWAPQEEKGVKYSVDLKDAKTGRVIFGQLSTKTDTGRALTGDIDPNYPGEEMWAPDGNIDNVWEANLGRLYSAQGKLLSDRIPSTSFAIWWDGDLSRELLNHSYQAELEAGPAAVEKWDYENYKQNKILEFDGFLSDGTKGEPMLQADLFGDWREEVILKSVDSTKLRIYTTVDPTDHRIYTLMHDPVYRLAVAWQNSAYNQPPHPSFFIGTGMTTPPQPNIYMVGAPSEVVVPVAPIASVQSGVYTSKQQVTLSTSTAGATIYYTTDGTAPTEESSVYSGPITVSKTLTLKAMAVLDHVVSDVSEYRYTISIQTGGNGDGNGGTTPSPSPGNPDLIITPAVDEADGASATVTIVEWNTLALAAERNGTNQVKIKLDQVDDVTNISINLPSVALNGSKALKIELVTPLGTLTLDSTILAGRITNNDTVEVSLAELVNVNHQNPVLTVQVEVNGQRIETDPFTIKASAHDGKQLLAIWNVNDNGTNLPINDIVKSPNGEVSFNSNGSGNYLFIYKQKEFNDIQALTWAQKEIEVLASLGIINGVSATEYNPSANITRADYIVLLMRTLKLDGELGEAFVDVPAGSYMDEPLRLARALGITNGQGNNQFNPYASITRQDMMTLTARALQIAGLLGDNADTNVLNQFNDGTSISSYSHSSIALLVEKGLIQGSNGQLMPNSSTNRAEAAVLIYNMLVADWNQ